MRYLSRCRLRGLSTWVYVLICTVGSVAGALLGYAIGAFLYETIGKWLIDLYSYDERDAQ
jgi:membrane protein YqaA with SNARE-associated domain